MPTKEEKEKIRIELIKERRRQVQARKEQERMMRKQRQEDILLGKTAPKSKEKVDLSNVSPIKPSSFFTKYYPVRGPDNVRLAVSLEELDQWLIPKRLPKLKYQNVSNSYSQSDKVEHPSQSNTLHQTPWDKSLAGAIPFSGRIWNPEKPVVHKVQENSSKDLVPHDNNRNDHIANGINEFTNENKMESQDNDKRTSVAHEGAKEINYDPYPEENQDVVSEGVKGVSSDYYTPVNEEYYYDVTVTNVSDSEGDDDSQSDAESTNSENANVTTMNESENSKNESENVTATDNKDFLTVPSERFKLGVKSSKRARTLQPAVQTGGLPLPEIRMISPTPSPSESD